MERALSSHKDWIQRYANINLYRFVSIHAWRLFVINVSYVAWLFAYSYGLIVHLHCDSRIPKGIPLITIEYHSVSFSTIGPFNDISAGPRGTLNGNLKYHSIPLNGTKN